jgi:hypothetical protein
VLESYSQCPFGHSSTDQEADRVFARLPKFKVVSLLAAFIALAVTPGSALGQAKAKSVSFKLGPIPGSFHYEQEGNSVVFGAELGGNIPKGNKAKRASLSVLIQYRNKGKTAWKKLSIPGNKTVRADLRGKSGFSMSLSQGHASVFKNTEWRIHYDAVYVDSRGTHKKVLTSNLLPT